MLGRRRPLLRGAAVGAAGYAIGKRGGQNDTADDGYDETGDGGDTGGDTGGMTDADIEQLRKLGQLKEEGILTQEEFDEQKRLLLGSG